MFSLHDFYVGIINLDRNDDSYERRRRELVEFGAICLDCTHGPAYDNKFLTLLYRIGHDDSLDEDCYMGLHDLMEYGVKEKPYHYCKLIGPLTDFIPKLPFSCPAVPEYEFSKYSVPTVESAHKLFDSVFGVGPRIEHSRMKYDIDRFYVGNLIIPNKAPTDIEMSPRIALLDNSSSLQLSNFNSPYRIYKSVFCDTSKGLYNINDFQIYPEIDTFFSEQAGYTLLSPLADDLRIFKSKISMDDALYYQKKLAKKYYD